MRFISKMPAPVIARLFNTFLLLERQRISLALCFCLFATLALVCPKSGFSQELAATLTGTVTDSTGAVIEGAAVTIHSRDTNADRTVATDRNGNYTATNLPAGNYEVVVKQPGFRTFTGENVILLVAEKHALNAELSPGNVSENVTVQENTTPVQTASSEQSGTITGTQVRNLELNNRNFEQLVLLQPGVTSALPDEVGFGLNNSTTISVNGARVTANNWTVDGADINDSGSNGTLLNVPSIDAIQEFTLQRSGYDAQYGRSGGGQVLVATKSGTTAFHGDVYEFVRNDFFNANSFFGNSSGTPRGIERYNDYGFTVGGPLFVPKLYKKQVSKTFFFWSEEWRKTSTPTTINIPGITPAMLAGTVSGPVTNAPAGCTTFNAGANTTTINPACYSKNAQAYLTNVFDKFPANSGSNYVTTYSAKNNYRQDIVRIDQTITDKLHFFARFMQDDVPQNRPIGLWGGNNYPGVTNVALDAPGKNAVGNLTWTISPTLVNEAEFAYSWGGINADLSGTGNSPSFVNSLTNNYAYADPYGRAPSVSIVGVTGLGQGSAPYVERNLDRNIFDNLSKTVGNHTFRTGFSVQWMQKTENGSSGAASFSFDSWSQFLLGNAAQYTQASRDTVPDLHYFNLEGYVQDDWKVTPHFTVNLGLRYSFFPTPTDVHNTLNNFDPLLYNPAAAPVINPVTGNFAAGQAIVPSTYTNGIIFPAGTACNNAKAISPQVTCSPFGSLVNPNSNNNWAPRVGFAWDPTGQGKTAIRGGYGIFYDRTLNGLWEQNAFTDPPLVQVTTVQNTRFDSPLAGTASVPLGPGSLDVSGTPTFKVPSYQDYNFSVQQQIAPNTEFEIAYVGGLGRHLLGEVDLNQVSQAVRLANPTANVNALRPYLGYSFFKARIPEFNSNYNSLQVSLNRHVAQGLTVGLAYTWSKNLTNASVDRDSATYNSYNFAQSYGPSTYNIPHVFIASYVYQLPFFKDQQGLVGRVFGGWEISGITRVQSGSSLTVAQTQDPFAAQYPGGIGAGTLNGSVQVRPDLVGPINGPGTVARYFNTAAFTPAVNHFGSAGSGIFLGPGLQNWDIAGIKNIKIAERFSLQFRGEFFNVFNHTNFSGVDTNISDASFGQITSAHDPRNVQLGLKLNF